jgi:hypothetical protein
MPASKKNLTVRLDDEDRETIELIASREYRTFANQIVVFVKQGIANYMKEHNLEVHKTFDSEQNINGIMLMKTIDHPDFSLEDSR